MYAVSSNLLSYRKFLCSLFCAITFSQLVAFFSEVTVATEAQLLRG